MHGRVAVAVRRRHRPQLDRVAHRRARAVRLYVVHLRGRHPGPPERVHNDLLLCHFARHRQPRAGTVLVQRGAPDDAPDAVAVRLRLTQPLEHQDAAALAAHVAVGGGIEGLAAPVGRQHAGIGAQCHQPPGQDGVHAAGQRQVGLALPQTGHRLMDGDE